MQKDKYHTYSHFWFTDLYRYIKLYIYMWIKSRIKTREGTNGSKETEGEG